MAKWRDKDLDQMFEMMVKEQDRALEVQIRGWAALGEVYQQQWLDLLEIKQAMQESWTSEGGQAYMTRLEEVITSLNTARTQASGNAQALDSVRSWIAASQSTLESLIIEFEEQALTEAWHKYYDDVDEANEWHDKGWFADDKPEEPNRAKVLEESGYNDRGKAVMDLVAAEIDQIRFNQLEYPSEYQGPTNSILAKNITPSMPGAGSPGAPGAPGMPNAPAMPAVPTPPTMPTAPGMPPGMQTTPQAPNMPNMPTPPTAPGAPGMPAAPGTPGMPGVPPTVASPGMPAGMSGRPKVANPMSNSRPVAPRGGVPGAPSAPTAPGKPTMPGKMAPPMGGMNPKGGKKGVKPGGPGRPGTPMGSSGIPPGKPGTPGKMAPPAGAVPPKNAKQSPQRKPGQPMHPASSGHPGKPGSAKGGKGGKPLAGKPGAARGGGQPGAGQFQAPPHIGRPTSKNKSKDQSGYGKFGGPEGTPLGAAPRVTKPGGSRPVLNNRAARPTQGPGKQELGVPASQRPRPKAPARKVDTRGVIAPGQDRQERTAPNISREEHAQKLQARRKDPETADCLNRLFKVAGLRPAVIEPAAPPKAHTAGPVIGT